MSVSKMKKLTLVVMKKDAGRVMRKLMWFGNFEIEREKSSVFGIKNDTLYVSERQDALSDADGISAALKLLARSGRVKSGLFSERPTVSKRDFENDVVGSEEYSALCETACKIRELDRKREEHEKECMALTERIEALTPWVECDMRLDGLSTRYTETILGVAPPSLDAEKSENELEANGTTAVIETVKREKGASYVSAVLLKEDKEKTLRMLSSLGISEIRFPLARMKPAEEISELSERIADIKKEMSDTLLSIDSFKERYDGLCIALDMAFTKAEIAEAKQNMTITERAAVISGWVPAEYENDLNDALSEYDVYYELCDPESGDDVPVRLVNKSPADRFEPVITMYSSPRYGTFDPTRVTAVFFFIIFGMMLADVVYGLIIALGGAFIAKKANASESVKNMCSMFSLCGISCVIWGIIFGSYLGDLPVRYTNEIFGADIKVPALIDIMKNAIVFLVLSLAVGAIHMLTGTAIRFVVLIRRGQIPSAMLGEGGKLVVFIGIGLCFMLKTLGVAIIACGVIMTVISGGIGEKRFIMKFIKGLGSLYGFVGYASDLLSYSRIMALGLSSAVVASVFNILAVMGGGGIFGIVVFIAVLTLGHALNLAINLLGAFVHTSRLQYVEFFGRFFEAGGRPFRPLRPHITHFTVIDGKSA